MVQTLEAIKGGGGSIRVGSTGTIGALITREMKSSRSAPQTALSSKNKLQTGPVSVPCYAATPKRLQPRKSFDALSSSSNRTGKIVNNQAPEGAPWKQKNNPKKTTHHHVPMLSGLDNVSLDGEKNDRKGLNMVEIVNLKCGNSDRAWASPITNRLRKLGFSKLSETIA